MVTNCWRNLLGSTLKKGKMLCAESTSGQVQRSLGASEVISWLFGVCCTALTHSWEIHSSVAICCVTPWYVKITSWNLTLVSSAVSVSAFQGGGHLKALSSTFKFTSPLLHHAVRRGTLSSWYHLVAWGITGFRFSMQDARSAAVEMLSWKTRRHHTRVNFLVSCFELCDNF